MTNVKNILENIKNLSLIESYFLVKELECLFDINITASPMISQQSIQTEKKEEIQIKEIETKEKLNFNIILNTIPSDNRMNLIKMLKNITGLSLKECKDLIDNIPKIIKENATKQECEDIKTELTNLGATIIIE